MCCLKPRSAHITLLTSITSENILFKHTSTSTCYGVRLALSTSSNTLAHLPAMEKGWPS